MAKTGNSQSARVTPADTANGILKNSAYHPIRYVTCTFDDGVLTIGGRLPSYHLKQVAQTAVEGIEGVVRIVNRIEVSR